ncbi:hypothetical protein FRC10_008380 [Ceratobasidium sp. 414]|nr:hypothetical protein FRC10_008380 [Ceratobasidium sp. 414]
MIYSLPLLLALAPYVLAAPAASSVTTSSTTQAVSSSSASTASAALPSPTVPYASDDPNDSLWSEFQESVPVPERGTTGASILGPQNIPLDRESPDFLAPPSTDSGSVSNVKWPFSLSHNRVQDGGWARQQNVDDMPLATTLAGVNMRLKAGAIRELHWHTAAEVFDDGKFSEDSTFQVTDWMAHVPKEVLAKNFRVNASAFDHIPARQLWMLPSVVPTVSAQEQGVTSPQGTVPLPFTFAASKAAATNVNGGSVKVIDSRTFNISKTIAAAEVTVVVGGMRELHWHPTQPEWTFFIEGNARITVFASSANARTFNYQAGDIGYVPPSFGHYVENIGNTTLKFLEIFNSDIYEDISLNQWLALTPPDMVKAHLQLSDDTISKLQKVKPIVVGPGLL